MVHFTSGELSIDVRHQPAGALRLTWRGRSAARAPALDLEPFLNGMLEQATALHLVIELHFEELEYFNSSTVTVLWDFVGRARAAKVPLTFTYTETVGWQRMSFGALRVVARVDPDVRVMTVTEAQAQGAAVPVEPR